MRGLSDKSGFVITAAIAAMASGMPVVAAPLSPPPSAKVLFLGVSADGAQSQLLTGKIAEHLRLGGWSLIELKPQDASSRKCTAADCLARLADAYSVERILTAEVAPPDSGVANLVVGLYNAISQGATQRVDVCVECGTDALTSKLRALSDNVLINNPSLPVVSVTVSAAPQPAAAGSLPAPHPLWWTPGRVAGTTLLGVLALSSLGVGAGLLVLDGQPGEGPCQYTSSPIPVNPSLCTYHTSRAATAGFTVGAVLGAGAIIFAVLPRKRPGSTTH